MPPRKHPRVAPEIIRERLTYNPETGELRWTGRFAKRLRKNGQPAGYLQPSGYVMLSINYCYLRGHVVAWVLMTGDYPKGVVDHINGNRSDNRWENLRDVTQVENMQNVHAPNRGNTSGYRGVCQYGRLGKFKAEININKQKRHLGTFDTAEEAYAAYLKAKLSGDLK